MPFPQFFEWRGGGGGGGEVGGGITNKSAASSHKETQRTNKHQHHRHRMISSKNYRESQKLSPFYKLKARKALVGRLSLCVG